LTNKKTILLLSEFWIRKHQIIKKSHRLHRFHKSARFIGRI